MWSLGTQLLTNQVQFNNQYVLIFTAMIYQYRQTASEDSGAYEDAAKSQYDLIDEDYYTDPDTYDTIPERENGSKPKSVTRDPYYIDILETEPARNARNSHKIKDYGSQQSNKDSHNQEGNGKDFTLHNIPREDGYLQPVSSLQK